MRKAAVAAGLMIAAGGAGLALAGTGLGPSIGILAGLAAVAGVVTFFGVQTEDLALFTVGLLVFTVTWNGIRIGGGAFGDVFLALAFAGVVLHVVSDKRPVPLPPWLFVAGVGVFLAGFLSMVFPPNVSLVQQSLLTELNFQAAHAGTAPVQLFSNTTELIYFEAALVLVPLLIVTVGTTRRRCRLLMDIWAAGAVINGAVGVLDYVGIHLAPTPISGHRSAGLTVQSNYLALTCSIAIPFAMMWFCRSRRWKLAGMIALALLLGGVYASGSRSGTVTALIAVAATFVLLPRLRPALQVVLPLAGMALVVALFFTKFGTKILHQLRLSGPSTSTAVSDYKRSTAASVAFSQFKARPIQGVGFSAIAFAHDIYLELLNAGGLIALASFLIFMGGIISAAVKSLFGPLRDEALVCSIAIIAWLANGIFDNQIADKYLYVVPGLLLAIARTSRAAQPAELPVMPDSAYPRPAPVPQTLAGVGAP